MGGAPGAGVPPPGQGAAEARSARRSSATPTSATRMGDDGVEQFVSTPELQSDDAIGTDPLPPGPGLGDQPRRRRTRIAGLYRIEVNVGPGLRRQDPQPAGAGAVPRERASRRAEPLTRARELVGDRDPRQHEFTFRCARSTPRGAAPVSGCPSSWPSRARSSKEPQGRPDRRRRPQPRRRLRDRPQRRRRCGAGRREGRAASLMPISARRQLNELSDDMATKISILYYGDARRGREAVAVTSAGRATVVRVAAAA